MNCYNHEDRNAVAQCLDCGVFLCKECASKWNPTLCDRCASERNFEHDRIVKAEQETKKNSERRLLLISAAFIIWTIIIGLPDIYQEIKQNVLTGILSALILIPISSLIFGGIPFGWVQLTNLRNKLNFILILPFAGWFIYFIIKFVLSILIGWFFFAIFLIRKFKNKK